MLQGWGKLSACAYSQMTHMLLPLANGRVLEVLEVRTDLRLSAEGHVWLSREAIACLN